MKQKQKQKELTNQPTSQQSKEQQSKMYTPVHDTIVQYNTYCTIQLPPGSLLSISLPLLPSAV